MSLGYVLIKADDGNIWDVNEVLEIKDGPKHTKITIFFEEYRPNSIVWSTPKGNDGLVAELHSYLLELGLQTVIGKPHGMGKMTKWEARIQVRTIPVGIVRENNGVCKGKQDRLDCDYTIAGGV